MYKKVFAILFLIVLNEVSFCQSQIEFFDLIKKFMPTFRNTLTDWMTFAENNSPIEWETEGTAWVNEKDYNYDLGTFMRQGKVIITIEKQPLFVLKKKKEALAWTIKLYGPRIGIYAIYLDNETIHYNNCFTPICIEKYFKKRGVIISLLKRDKDGQESGGSALFKILINNRPVYLLTEFSEGSAGEMGSFLIFYDEPNASVLSKRNLN